MIFSLVHYGKFTPEYVEDMKPFERDYYLELTKDAFEKEQEFQMGIHGAKKG